MGDEGKIVICLTVGPHVRIKTADWPIIAHVARPENWLVVRRHADGRTIVYGARLASAVRDFQSESFGEILPEGGHVTSAVYSVASHCGLDCLSIRTVVACLPPEDI